MPAGARGRNVRGSAGCSRAIHRASGPRAGHGGRVASRRLIGLMFTLAHLSDPHLGPLPRPRLNHLLSKRLIGYLNWTSNRFRVHRPEVLTELIHNIHAAEP